MNTVKLCRGCGESVDDPGMDLCSHCAETKAQCQFRIINTDADYVPPLPWKWTSPKITPGKRQRSYGKGPRHMKAKR